MNDLDLIDSNISQLSETVLPNFLLYDDSKISIAKNSQICRVPSNVLSQRNVLMSHSSKHLSYMCCLLLLFVNSFHDDEFFGTGEVYWNRGTLTNVSRTT